MARDRRLVAGRRLDTLLTDEAVGKTLHRRRWNVGVSTPGRSGCHGSGAAVGRGDV